VSRAALAALVAAEIRVGGFASISYLRLRETAGEELVADLCDDVAAETGTRWAYDATAITVIFTPKVEG
jgi:hypothetical protein